MNALASVVAPLIACTTRMPFDVVGAPVPPTFVTLRVVEPVAVPPLTTSLSELELSAASTALSAIVPLLPT